MTIRARLFLLVAMLVVSFVISGAIYFFERAPLAEIQSEEATLTSLRELLLEETVEANRLTWSPFTDQLARFEKARAATAAGFSAVEKLQVLPKLSTSIRDALDNIRTLKAVLDTNTEAFLNAAHQIQTDAAKIPQLPASFDIYHLASNPHLTSTEAGSAAMTSADQLLTQLYILSSRISVSERVVEDQEASISTEVQRIETRSTLTAGAIILALVLVTVLIALLFSSRISRSIRRIEENIAELRKGDLRREFRIDSRDEVGALSTNLNQFVRALSASVHAIQQASDENVQLKESVIATVEQTSASATEIAANTGSIDNQISTLDQTISSADQAVDEITRHIRELDEQISQQATMVEQSTASVTQMIASIDSIARTTEQQRASTGELVNAVANGGEKVITALQLVNEIDESVESISGIATIIQSISAQTNLLAMNAAIEAAHAGEAGRGFSVVADEIRKLAEASSGNSKQISRIISTVVDRIKVAGEAGTDMNSAFMRIDEGVRAFSDSLARIFESMEELRVGENQISEAMTSLQEISVNVRDGSKSISSNASAIRDTVGETKRISSEVSHGMAEISHGIEEISKAVQNVLSIAEHLGQVSETLNGEISRFSTE
jgi:methyl-accepting chemotaxis protein